MKRIVFMEKFICIHGNDNCALLCAGQSNVFRHEEVAFISRRPAFDNRAQGRCNQTCFAQGRMLSNTPLRRENQMNCKNVSAD